MKSFEKPTNEAVDAAVSLVSSPQHEAYFFEHLQNPHWISPLRERHVFDHPPKAESVSGGGVRFPRWQASRYLARMAVDSPSDVAAILSSVETDNASVNDDIIDAALAMPVSQAATLEPVISAAAQSGRLWNGFENACSLCVRLANADKVTSAVRLFKALFGPLIEARPKRGGRRDMHFYRNSLDDVVPVLARKDFGFLTMLCGWLSTLIQAEKHFDRESGFDHSYAWRPAIEESEQNSDNDLSSVLVSVVRTAFEEAIRSRLSLAEALTLTSQYQYLIFKRLRLHLINEFADHDLGLARSTILNPALFDDYQFRHEYGTLVGHHFELLSRDEQERWFAWVDAGPDMPDFGKSAEENVGRAATEADRQGRIDYWKFEKLHWVRNRLIGERKAFYERMMAEHGEPKLAYFVVWSGRTRWGRESPATIDTLSQMGFEDALRFVSCWKPKPGDFDGPSIEGLATTFEQFVGGSSSTFSMHARLLIGKPAYVVRPFMTKMSSALASEGGVDFAAVLDLCRWVIAQSTPTPKVLATEFGDTSDENWHWARTEVTRFLVALCSATVSGTPKYSVNELRKPVWDLISPLCDDPATSTIVFDVAQQDPRVHDYLDLGINSDRGQAIEAVLEYGRWVANHLKQNVGGKEHVPGGFESMPEVRAVLDAEIATERRTFEVLSIIGSRASLIYWIDKGWLAANANSICRLEGIEEGFASAQGWAAWNAFLVWQPPHYEFYELFRAQFAYAVKEAAKVLPSERGREQPMNHLGEHLMVLYGRGQLTLHDDGGLLRQFLNTANPDIRRHAIRFIASTLETSQDIPEDVLRRFQALWTTYWSGVGRTDARVKPTDSSFGDWFSSGKFPNGWALEQLEGFLEIVPTPPTDYEIAQRLAIVAPTDPARSARILDKMIRGDNEGWRPAGWIDSAKKVLEVAIAAGGEAQSVAHGTIDFLGRRGYVEAGEVLKK